MKYLLFIFLIFVIGCEKEHTCKECQMITVVLEDNSTYRGVPFTACGEELRKVDGAVIRVIDEDGAGFTQVSTIICK
jgi:hypothetical protein